VLAVPLTNQKGVAAEKTKAETERPRKEKRIPVKE
jgi:hypothetical protein